MFRLLNHAKSGSGRHWSRVHLASFGALLGMGIALTHHAQHAFVGDITNENPLTHIVPELIGFVAVGAFALAIIAEVQNRL